MAGPRNLLWISLVAAVGCGGGSPTLSQRTDLEESDSAAGPSQPPEFWAARLGSDQVVVRREALAELGTYGRAAAPYVGAIAGRFGDADEKTGYIAAWTLSRIGTPAHGTLLRLLASPNDLVRQQAAYGLGETKLEAALPALDSASRNDRSAGVRNMADWAIDQMSQRGSVSDPTMFLSIGLDDQNPAVRIEAVQRLSVTASSNMLAIPLLIRSLNDSVPSVRNSAIDALAQAGPVASTALSAALTVKSRTVRAGAMLGLANRHRSF